MLGVGEGECSPDSHRQTIKLQNFSPWNGVLRNFPFPNPSGFLPQISLVYRYKPILGLPSWTFGCGTAPARPAPSPGRGPYKMMPTFLSPIYGEDSGTTPRYLVDTGPTSPLGCI